MHRGRDQSIRRTEIRQERERVQEEEVERAEKIIQRKVEQRQMDEAAIRDKAVSGYWACSNCSNVEFYEREIKCWKCGKGEMLYQDKEALRSFIKQATAAFKKVQEAEEREAAAHDAGWDEAIEAAALEMKRLLGNDHGLVRRLRKGKP